MAEEGQGVKRKRRRSGRHRSSEPPPLEPPSLRDELKYNFRALVAVPLLSLIATLWGVDAALDGGRGWGHRLLGVAALASGVLFGTSLWLTSARALWLLMSGESTPDDVGLAPH